MTMYGKYDLLRREIARNPVDFVILDATYNSMTRNRDREGPEGDIYQLGRYRNFFTRTSYFFKTIRLDEYGRVYYDMLSRGVYAWKALCSDKETGTALQYKTRGFLPMRDAVAVQQPEVAAYHSVPLETSLDADCMDYMDKIISLCQARGITVFVIVTPISQAATVKFDDMDAMYQELDAFFAEYGVTFLDFNLYHEKQQLFPDASAYSDETHMSAEGAADFSVLLAHTIQRWRSGEGLSGDFYASYAVAEAAWLAADSP